AAGEHRHRPPPRAAAQAESHDQQHRVAVAGALPVQLGAPIEGAGQAGGAAHRSNAQRTAEACRAAMSRVRSAYSATTERSGASGRLKATSCCVATAVPTAAS